MTQQLDRLIYKKEEDCFLQWARMHVPTQTIVVYTERDNGSHEVLFFDRKTGQLIRQFNIPNNVLNFSLSLSSDGCYAAAADRRKGEAIVWETDGGRVVRRFRPPPKAGGVFDVVFGFDGRSVLVGTGGFNIPEHMIPVSYLWDPFSGDSRPWMSVPEEFLMISPHSMVMSPHRRLLASCGLANKLRSDDINQGFIWDATGDFVRSFPADQHSDPVSFSSDERLLLIQRDGGRSPGEHIDVVAVETGAIVRTIDGKFNSFLPDGRLVSTSDAFGNESIVDLSTGQALVRVIRMANVEDWIAVTPEGLFDGTESARKLVAFRTIGSHELVADDLFIKERYRPGLIAEVFAGGRPVPGGAPAAANGQGTSFPVQPSSPRPE